MIRRWPTCSGAGVSPGTDAPRDVLFDASASTE